MRPCLARIHLDRLRANYREIKAVCGEGVELFPVVKADAYGHGAIPCAKALLSEGVRTLCVACVEEALEIIDSGVLARFILLSGVFPGEEKDVLQYGLIPVISDLESAQMLDLAVKNSRTGRGKKIKVHLKVDTGMGRLGVLPEDFSGLLNGIRKLDGLEVEGMLSHLSCAGSSSEKDVRFTNKQIEDFQMIQSALARQGTPVRFFHLAQSAGLIKYPESRFNSARPGLAIYGADPFYPRQSEDGRGGESEAKMPHLEPVMSLISRICLIKTVPQGSAISYGATTVVKRKTSLGVVSVGYADGLPRSVPAGFNFMVRGRPGALLGVVTMDLIMIDLTEIPEARLGDEVVIFGKEPRGEVSVSALALSGGTIAYEIFTRLGKRVKREYTPAV